MTTSSGTAVPAVFPPATSRRSSRLALAIILTCQLMVILDATIVTIALPKIRATLDFSPTSLSWVQNAYSLAFGGLLLLGARAGDILGRRRVFVAGVAVFSITSLLGGLALSAGWLLAARAVQGMGAAIAAPSTLALLASTFPEGAQRVRALSLYSAVSSGGASIGLVLGGMLTDWVSWRRALLINVPSASHWCGLLPITCPRPSRGRRGST
jgi:MFS family permease